MTRIEGTLKLENVQIGMLNLLDMAKATAETEAAELPPFTDEALDRTSLYVTSGYQQYRSELMGHWPSIDVANWVFAPDRLLSPQEQKSLIKLSWAERPATARATNTEEQNREAFLAGITHAGQAQRGLDKSVEADFKNMLSAILWGSGGIRYYSSDLARTSPDYRKLTTEIPRVFDANRIARLGYSAASALFREGIAKEVVIIRRRDHVLAAGIIAAANKEGQMAAEKGLPPSHGVALVDYRHLGVQALLSARGYLPNNLMPAQITTETDDEIVPKEYEDEPGAEDRTGEFYGAFDGLRYPVNQVLDHRIAALLKQRFGFELTDVDIARSIMAVLAVGKLHQLHRTYPKEHIGHHLNFMAAVVDRYSVAEVKALMTDLSVLPPAMQVTRVSKSIDQKANELFDSEDITK